MNKGLTLIEILIVTFIIGMMAVIGTTTYQKQGKQFEFNQSLTEILSMVKTARNMAVTNQTLSGGSVSTGGFGVHIKNDGTFVLFANINDDKKFDNTDLTLKTYTLPDGVFFKKEGEVDSKIKGLYLPNNSDPIGIDDNTDEVVIIFAALTAKVFLGNNLNTDINNDLEMRFTYEDAPTEVKRVITLNRISGFPELKDASL